MKLEVLEETRLKSLERILVEKANNITAKTEKTLLDYVILLETVIECRSIQEKMFDIQKKQNSYSEQELEDLVSEYTQNIDMPCRELFFNKEVK